MEEDSRIEQYKDNRADVIIGQSLNQNMKILVQIHDQHGLLFCKKGND